MGNSLQSYLIVIYRMNKLIEPTNCFYSVNKINTCPYKNALLTGSIF